MKITTEARTAIIKDRLSKGTFDNCPRCKREAEEYAKKQEKEEKVNDLEDKK